MTAFCSFFCSGVGDALIVKFKRIRNYLHLSDVNGTLIKRVFRQLENSMTVPKEAGRKKREIKRRSKVWVR